MTFPLTPSAPFVPFVSVITSAFLNTVRVCVNEALDGTGGSAGNPYVPSTPIEVEGSGMYIDPLSAWVRSGHFLNIDSGGDLTTEPGANVAFNSTVTFGGDTLFSGAVNVVQSGEWEFLVDTFQLAGSTLHIGSSTMGSPGHLVVNGNGGASGSDVTFEGDAQCTFETGTTLLTDAGSTSTFNGAVGLAGTTTQTGAYVKSGVNAITQDRVTTVDPASSSYGSGAPDAIYMADILGFDEYRLVSSGSIVLPDPTSLPVGAKVRFYIDTNDDYNADFYPFFGISAPISTKLFNMNWNGSSHGTPLSQGLACVAVSFLVTAFGWKVDDSVGTFA